MSRTGKETTPLIRPRQEDEARRKDGAHVCARIFVYIVAVIIISTISIGFYDAAPSESSCERMRQDTRERWEREKQQWEWEKQQWEGEKQQWEGEKRHHQDEVLGWKDEIEGYRKQKSGLVERLENLIREKGKELSGLERRAKKVENDVNEALERLKERENEIGRKEGDAIERLRRRVREAEEKEDAAFQRMKEFEKQLREKKEEYAKMGIYWADAKPAEQCRGHDSIEYTARLANVRPDVDAVKACHSTPLILHGKTYESPNYCEVLGEGNVYGHWVVTGEYKCQTYWEFNTHDKGCTMPGSGVRRFERGLGGIHDGQDWENLCYTTPVDLMKQHFDRPHMCLNWGNNGVWGIWDVVDSACN